MSDIIIEGKNLNDINQSNFQTVGVRSGFHFITDPNATLSADESVFKYDVLKIHRTRLGDEYTNVLLPTELLEFVTIEPWQGRLHYDKDFSDITQVNLLNGFSWDDSWQPRNQDAIFKMRIPEFITYPNNLYMDDRDIVISDNFIPLYYPYFYTGNIYSTDDIINIFSANDITKYKVNNSFGRYNNFLSKGFEQRTNDAFIVKDERFPLGTYTEEDKKHWEIQTSDLITRESQFSQTRMQTAQSSKIVESQLIKSEEEEFSVDALVFTEREGVITPLCFYYDKNLHPIEYNNASTGKINMKVELRGSGRNGYNEIDLYQERKVVRPFLMGFEKDEQPNSGTNPLTNESLIGTGNVYGEGLYYADTRITLTSLPDANSYLLGIFDIPDDNLVSTTGNYTFMMPSRDIQYLTKFRPNPYIIMRQRFTDQFGNDTIGGPNSKGEIRLWESEIHEDEGDYVMRPLNNGDKPAFKVSGARFFEDTFRPFDFDGNLITLEQREVTDNYKFKGFTYLSGSVDSQEVPFEILEDVENIDQNYYGPVGSDETNIRTIKLVQDFFYPAGRLNIYANYGLITFAIHNFNNTVDFENDFGGALRYGPFKFATVLGGQLGGAPNPENYRFDDLTTFPTFGLNEPTVRLLISGPEMGYANPGTTPPIEPIPQTPPENWSPTNPMTGTLSPEGQWIWNGGPWVENPNYNPSDYLSFADYLPSGEYGHLTPMEETGFDFGKFIWLKQGNPNFPDGEPIEIYKDISNLDLIPNTLESAIDIAGEFPPTYNSSGFNDTVSGTQFSPNGYSVGDTAGPGGIFIVTNVEQSENSDPYENPPQYIWDISWGPNLTEENTPDLGNLYDLSNNENDFQGINLRGDVGDDGFLVGNNIINQIISTETTSSISYRPTYRGTYVKAFDDGIAVPTFIQQAPLSDEPIRPRSLSGVIDADMYELGSQVIFSMTPTIVPGIESMPPDITAYIGRDNGTKTLSTNIDSDLTLENLGVEIGDWNPLEGGTFTYNVPDSRDAVTENSQARKWWKYIEFRIVVSETAESEEEQNASEGDIQYHTNILYSAYFRNQDGSLEQVSFSSPYSISSPPPETNFPPPDGIGDMNLYDTFDDIPNFSRRVSAYVEGGPERIVEEWIIADRAFLDTFATNPGDLYYGIDIPASSVNLASGGIVGNSTQQTGVLEASEAGLLNVVVIFAEGAGM